MPITPGTRLGPYEVLAAIGAGGMGEVYRARDPRLGRDVAIKVLPSQVAGDPERMARFEREAQMLAALNHSNIATIHGLEDWNGTRALVMELVEGSTLAERISAGALPADEVVTIARQIAEALEYAHERGIIHRDLKPANIKIDAEGQVRILDFGLAKALADDSAAQDISSSPTLSMAATKAGLILGTAAYMAPEQARGKAVDRRADIWAFGCVLYEMLTGRPAFHGDNVSDILASVLKTEPDWQLPAGTPPAVARLVRRCLEKDPKRRLQAIGEARIALEGGLSEPVELGHAASQPGKRAWLDKVAWGTAAILLVATAILGSMLLNRATPSQPVKRSIVTLPAGEIFPAVANSGVMAISADGSLLVTSGSRRKQGTGWQLYLRQMDQSEFKPLDGTDDAYSPFFSPDGKWIGFMGGGKLKKIPAQGGAVTTICDLSIIRGASWGPDDTIVFSAGAVGAGLYAVPAGGGVPKPLTVADSKKNDVNHRWPFHLPGGKQLLFTTQTNFTSLDDSNIEVLNTESGQRKVLVENGTAPRYMDGYLLFGRSGALYAAPFDLNRLELTGPAVPVLESVWGDAPSGTLHYSTAEDGTLVFVEGATQARTSRLGLMDRKGAVQSITVPAQSYVTPAMSPEGKRVAVTVQSGNTDIWVVDLARNSATRLTFNPAEDETSAWTPDGKRIAYSAATEKGRALVWKNADGSGGEEVLWTGGTHHHVTSFSPDGRFLMYVDYDNSTKGDIFYLPVLEKDRQPQKFLQTPFNERSGAFSPDGKWVAYTSDESGRDEVYVQPFPGPGGKWQVSTEGGYGPVWSRNGRELFFRLQAKLMATEIRPGASFAASTPRQLLEATFESVPRREADYDISADGRHFIVIQSPDGNDTISQLHLVTNWVEELKRKAPSAKK